MAVREFGTTKRSSVWLKSTSRRLRVLIIWANSLHVYLWGLIPLRSTLTRSRVLIKWSTCLTLRITKISHFRLSRSKMSRRRFGAWSFRQMDSICYLELERMKSCFLTPTKEILYTGSWANSQLKQILTHLWAWSAVFRPTPDMSSRALAIKGKTCLSGTLKAARRYPWCNFILPPLAVPSFHMSTVWLSRRARILLCGFQAAWLASEW